MEGEDQFPAEARMAMEGGRQGDGLQRHLASIWRSDLPQVNSQNIRVAS